MEVTRITYDADRDVLDIFFDGGPAVKTIEGLRGLTAELDANGDYVAIHVPDATPLLKTPASMVTG